MSGTFTVEWLPGNVLLQKRTGTLTPEQIAAYVAAAHEAISAAPARWGLLLDISGGSSVLGDDETTSRQLIAFALEHGVSQVSAVTMNAIVGLQQRRTASQIEWPDTCGLTFYTDYPTALAALKRALAPTHAAAS